MVASTSFRTAGGTDSAGHGPDAADRWPEPTRTAPAVTGGRGGGGDARVGGQADWRVTVEGFWCTAGPSAGELPDEGWKPHVSAASAVGGAVLATVTEVLAEDPCAFRSAAGPAQLHRLNSRDSARGSAGRCITVHPGGEPRLRRPAAALHRATDGLPGPAVLSDRPYRPGAGRATPRRRGSGGVLPAGRYVVTGAIRHGAKGGVLRGRETDGGAEVVVRQTRAHIEVDHAGADARAALRHEADPLARPEGREPAPRPVEPVEQDDALHLVQERIAGEPLGSRAGSRADAAGTPGCRAPEQGLERLAAAPDPTGTVAA
ncbi:hypothetical protein ACFVVU_28880 [Kitasatospora sp. NPDC057965]|uniref:class III lanthionine synthetase LanKC N-terminal domain-containing protein n=1 Tax=Kitasatospora sp. NPDC057965 TaxID=3346291 RepID=UPI0036DD40F3